LLLTLATLAILLTTYPICRPRPFWRRLPPNT
jgi:hypothetical protein